MRTAKALSVTVRPDSVHGEVIIVDTVGQIWERRRVYTESGAATNDYEWVQIPGPAIP